MVASLKKNFFAASLNRVHLFPYEKEPAILRIASVNVQMEINIPNVPVWSAIIVFPALNWNIVKWLIIQLPVYVSLVKTHFPYSVVQTTIPHVKDFHVPKIRTAGIKGNIQHKNWWIIKFILLCYKNVSCHGRIFYIILMNVLVRLSLHVNVNLGAKLRIALSRLDPRTMEHKYAKKGNWEFNYWVVLLMKRCWIHTLN